MMNSIPDSIAGWLQPAAKPLLQFKRVSGTAHRFPLTSMANAAHSFPTTLANLAAAPQSVVTPAPSAG